MAKQYILLFGNEAQILWAPCIFTSIKSDWQLEVLARGEIHRLHVLVFSAGVNATANVHTVCSGQLIVHSFAVRLGEEAECGVERHCV